MHMYITAYKTYMVCILMLIHAWGTALHLYFLGLFIFCLFIFVIDLSSFKKLFVLWLVTQPFPPFSVCTIFHIYTQIYNF